MTHDKYLELRSAIIAGDGVEALELLWAQQQESGSKPTSETKCGCAARKALEAITCNAMPHVDLADMARAVLSAPCSCEGLREELAEAREYATEAMLSLNTISESAGELAALLREQWKAPPELDAVTLYCAAILSGFASAWKGNPPENGFVSALKFADIGILEIQIRRIDGKGSAEALRGLTVERDQLRAQVAEHQNWLKADSQYAENQRLRAELAEARKDKNIR